MHGDRPMYYRRKDLQPITPSEWVDLSMDDWEGERRVALWEEGEVRVSTVFLGLDHSYWDGPPILFETMVFGGALDQEQERYATEEEALAGHERWVSRAKVALDG